MIENIPRAVHDTRLGYRVDLYTHTQTHELSLVDTINTAYIVQVAIELGFHAKLFVTIWLSTFEVADLVEVIGVGDFPIGQI